ncbi:hypothetical protein EOD39_9090 [Acipenser ruthenus]|uniref:Uncharacterized protein n=1 Tax=Acipenser ruthenus TaxID=7906 RepID=A0A662YX11_ACIRT|nr:hypothetical protein EOD39_9090 [Acipenser ruthenus]
MRSARTPALLFVDIHVRHGWTDLPLPPVGPHAKFCLAALTNNWRIEELAGQLAAALERKAMQALLDLDPEEPCDFHILSTALQCRFRKVASDVSLRKHLATRKRGSCDKLGILAADTKYLERKGYPGLQPGVQEDLAIRGVHLRSEAHRALKIGLAFRPNLPRAGFDPRPKD